MAVLTAREANLRLGNGRLLGAISAMLFGPRPKHVEADERSYDQDHKEKKAQRPDDANLSPCPLPGSPFMAELGLKHLEKFFRFVLAETVGLQGFFLAHRIWNLQVAYRRGESCSPTSCQWPCS